MGRVKVVLSGVPALSEKTAKNVLPGVDVLVQIGKAAKSVLLAVDVFVLKALQEPSAMIVLHLLDARLVVDTAVQKDHVHLVEMKGPGLLSVNVLLVSAVVADHQSSADFKRPRAA